MGQNAEYNAYEQDETHAGLGRWAIPSSWIWSRHDAIATVNPKTNNSLPDDLPVTFLPMANVAELSGIIDRHITRPYKEVKKGFTSFSDGDLIFAKITPCMENGKVAIVDGLKNAIGFGSTEFHVSRPSNDIDRKFLFYFLVQERLRRNARRKMTGSAGQLRVPTEYFKSIQIPIPPHKEQQRIVAKIEELFTDLDKSAESLRMAQSQLKIYRQALLKHAFDGTLTARWREAQGKELQNADALLIRIQQERTLQYENQISAWRRAVKSWELDGKKGAKPSKPAKIRQLPARIEEDTEEYGHLPELWKWTCFCNVTYKIGDVDHKMPKELADGFPYLSTGDLKPDGTIDFENAKRISKEDFDRLALKIQPQRGDIIFPRYGTIGRNFLVEFDRDFLVSYSCAIIKNINSLMSEKYIYYYSLSPTVKKEIERYKVQTTQANIGIASIEKFVFPLCSKEEQLQVVAELERCLSVADSIAKDISDSIEKVEFLRESILKSAFEGKLVPQDSSEQPLIHLKTDLNLTNSNGVSHKISKGKGKKK